MTIGYVGLGNMGGALARRLRLTHPLVVYDLNPAAVEAMVQAGAERATSLVELAQRCDIVMLCLPTTDFVREAVFGKSGLIEGLKPGSLLIDQTTGDPVGTRALAKELSERGMRLIDAPVSGGAQGAEAGTIGIMVGASEADFKRARPLLEAISNNIHLAGEVGAGQIIKLANNMMSAATRLITYEGVALAVKNGLDAETACKILLSGGARNSFLEKFMAPKVIKGDLASGFTMGLMHKDVRLACQLGSATGVPMFMGNLTQQMYELGIAELGYDAQVHSMALLVDKLAGTAVVPKDG